jgi:hypothetical protein
MKSIRHTHPNSPPCWAALWFGDWCALDIRKVGALAYNGASNHQDRIAMRDNSMDNTL